MAPDRTLAARLEALLPTMEEGTDIDDIVSTLRDRHAEYRRHKTGPFKQLVLRALEAVRKKHPELFGGDSEVGGGCTECGCPLRSRVPRVSTLSIAHSSQMGAQEEGASAMGRGDEDAAALGPAEEVGSGMNHSIMKLYNTPAKQGGDQEPGLEQEEGVAKLQLDDEVSEAPAGGGSVPASSKQAKRAAALASSR